MPKEKPNLPDKGEGVGGSGENKDGKTNILNGTTLRVYRFLYKEGRPTGIRDLQRGLGLSSSSVSLYHIRKLLEAGLVREQDGGYVVDKAVFENLIRVRRALIPFQTTYSVFSAATLVTMLTFLRPPSLSSLYLFALIANSGTLGIFLFETIKTLKQTRS